MTVILQDPVLPRDPSAGHAFPELDSEARARLNPPRTLAEELLALFRSGRMAGETSFDLESHGGYARTVTGKVAYLDQEAHTFMVRARDGNLMRVPLRDVRSTHGISWERDQLEPTGDAEGLGTGEPAGRASAAPSHPVRGSEAETFFEDLPERSDDFFSNEPSQAR